MKSSGNKKLDSERGDQVVSRFSLSETPLNNAVNFKNRSK